MFDFSATEFLIIALVALIVIGPRELPGLLRQVGQMVGKVRRMASEFQDQLNTAVESSEIQDLKKEVGKLADDAKVDMNYDIAGDVDREIHDAVAGKPSSGDKKDEIQNPDYGNDPDDALVDFPETEAGKSSQKPSQPAAAASTNDAKGGAKQGNAIVREPSTPRAAAPAKRLPVNAGNTSKADFVAAKPENNDGKPVTSES